MKRLPDQMEATVNEVLHGPAIRIAVEEITRLIPVSTQKGKVRNKTHARMIAWSKNETHNLGFTIRSKNGARGTSYLVFPDQGIGAHNPDSQQFMKRGMDIATPKILNLLNENIDRKIREVL